MRLQPELAQAAAPAAQWQQAHTRPYTCSSAVENQRIVNGIVSARGGGQHEGRNGSTVCPGQPAMLHFLRHLRSAEWHFGRLRQHIELVTIRNPMSADKLALTQADADSVQR